MLKYLEEIDRFLSANNLDKKDICIVGSAVFAINGIRENNDIDFIIHPSVLKKVMKKYQMKIGISGYFEVDQNADLYVNRYFLLGINDINIFNKENHFIYSGYKVIRPEIEYSYKVIINRKKDSADIKVINKKLLLSKLIDHECIKRFTEKSSFYFLKRKLIIKFYRVINNPKTLIISLRNRLKCYFFKEK